MKKHFRNLSMLMTLMVSLFLCAGLTSCGGDDDEPDPGLSSTSYYDYSLLWTVVDRGDYTPAEAQKVAASFSEESEDLIEHATISEAKEIFDLFMQELRYEFNEGYKNIVLRANLVATEKPEYVIATHTLTITPTGSTVNAPAKSDNPLLLQAAKTMQQKLAAKSYMHIAQ